MKKAKLSFFVFLQELSTVISYTIIGLILSLLHVLGLKGFEIKALPFFIVFWSIIGLALYLFAFAAFGKSSSSDFFTKRFFPYYIPIADVDSYDTLPTYPNTSHFANVRDCFEDFFNNYWKESAKKRSKTGRARFLIFYFLFFGGLIVAAVLTIVVCFRDATTIKRVINAYNAITENAKTGVYNVIKTDGDDLKMLLAQANETTITGWNFYTCAYLIGVLSYSVVILTCIFIHRLNILFTFSCGKCGNVALFSSEIEHYYEGEYYVHSTDENEEQIGTIQKKGLCGTTKDVADVYVTRKDHYRSKVSTSTEEYGCVCPFCGRKKKITVSGFEVGKREYDHSSY